MPVTEQSLLDFFIKVAIRDRHQLKRLIQDPRFELNAGYWNFKLPDLHRHLGKYNHLFNTMSYLKFRKAIYNCPIQQAINNYGSRVMITDNHHNVDRSTYTLVWQENTDDIGG